MKAGKVLIRRKKEGPEEMENSCKLSEGMVVQILSRLRPKSLMRFRCVRKLWFTIINNPSFVAKNLSNSYHNEFASSTCILFKRTIFKDNNIKDEEIDDILRDDYNNKKQVLLSSLNLCNNINDEGNDHYLHYVVEDLNVPPHLSLPHILRLVGHCDGIICLHTYFDNVALCNPAIKEFKYLPKSCLIPPQNQDGFVLVSYSSSLGFGYDSKAKDYKVVRIAQTGNYKYPTRVEVYTLGTNSWREIKADINCSVYITPSSQLYFKGIYYWIVFMRDNNKEFLLSFDMGDELFQCISVPDGFNAGDKSSRSLFVWKGSIVLLSYQSYTVNIPNSFEIWVMDDFAEDLWTKYLTIGPLDDIEIPLVFSTSDELFMAKVDGNIVSYNLCTHTFKSIPIHGVELVTCIQALIYVDSIVSVTVNERQVIV